MLHRGPDEQTTFREENLVLHHHRLSILDIEGGKQPMSSGDLVIIFNGEMYNHNEVRSKYGLNGKTHSDTETILLAYALKGPACLHDFDGMYALAIYDRSKKELFLARDRAGKKPLYYYKNGESFFFASELNAIRSQVTLAVNEKSIRQYIRLGYFYKTATPYQQVFEFPPGSYAILSLKSPTVEPVKWWNIHAYYERETACTNEEISHKTEQALHNAVKNRIESSDLEVGSFLSGGIDSGIITAIAAQYKQSLKTFTVSFDGEYDEAPLARLVAERYNTQHHEIKISFSNLVNDIEKILLNYGEPFFDSSAIPSYYVSAAAKQHLTVILNGDGGDELFGGYRRYVPFSKFDFFNSGPLTKKTAALLFKFLPVSNNKKSKYNYLYRLTDLARKDRLSVYLSSTIDSFEGFENFLFTNEDHLLEVKEDFDKINESGLSGLQKIMNLDFDNILACNLLVKMDIATMAHSLEGRSPLLSKDILEFLPTVPDEYKIKGTKTKFLLREIAGKYLPGDLIHQPKRGFEIPLKKWVDGELQEIIGDYILSPNACSSNYTSPGFIEQLWNRKMKTGDEKRAKMIWTLFALEVWYRKCYLKQ